jgi:hypothetical protein
MATATILANGDLFRNFQQAERRQYQIDFAPRLLGAEVFSTFAWFVPTGLSAVASSTAFAWGLFNSATASGADISSASASALSSGSAYAQVVLSGQANFATGTGYIVSGQVNTNAAHTYIEAFKVDTWNGINPNG